MSDVARTTEVAAADTPAVKPAARTRALSARAMIDRYKWYEVVALYAGMAVFLFFVLAPFIEGFLVSLKPLSQLFSTPYSFIPHNGSFEAYFTMWQSVPMLAMYIFNSFFISTVVTAVVILVVVPAAYAFARFQFTGAGMMLGGFLAVNMFSGAVLLIPLFRLMRELGLLNTYWAMIVPGAAFLIPSSIWLLRTYLMRIPRELDEAARTGRVPAGLLRRWERALEDVAVWRFRPVVVHGDLSADHILCSAERPVAVLGWSEAKVADPADDLAWLLVAAPHEAVDAILEAYTLRRTEMRDPHLETRALLAGELALARWLLHGVRSEDPAIVEDATAMLAELAEQTAEDEPAVAPSGAVPESADDEAEAGEGEAPAGDADEPGEPTEPTDVDEPTDEPDEAPAEPDETPDPDDDEPAQPA